MIVKLIRYHTGRWYFAQRAALGRMVFMLLLSGASWQAEGQWLQEEKARMPLGQSEGNWVPLANDKIHDPRGPAIRQLQEPGTGLSELPATDSGNRVLWAKALDRGAINPRRTKAPSKTNVQVLDMDVLMDLRGNMPIVRFPHKIHTQWLACNNCHEGLFKSQIGANKIQMYYLLQGEQCGLCHGSVAFPLTQCAFCHSVERQTQRYIAPLPDGKGE